MTLENLTADAIQLLKDLIEIPSFSSEEQLTAERIEAWFTSYNIPFQRSQNNVWVTNSDFDPSKPTLALKWRLNFKWCNVQRFVFPRIIT